MKLMVLYKQVMRGKWRYFITDPAGKHLHGPYAKREACDNQVERMLAKGWAWVGED